MINDKVFNKDGQPTKRKFRVYCAKKRCKNFVIGKWGGGYACITTKEGNFDWRNQEFWCDKHSKDEKVRRNEPEKI